MESGRQHDLVSMHSTLSEWVGLWALPWQDLWYLGTVG